MIRINLLPVRAAKKKETIRFQLTVAGLITFLVVAVSLLLYVLKASEVSAIEEEIADGQQELARLTIEVGELSKIKQQKAVVQGKLDVVGRLEKGRSGPVNLFTRVADAIPEKAWITSLRQSPSVVVLEGFAATDEVVADFMRGLERHPALGAVELEVAKRGTGKKDSPAGLVEFSIRLDQR
ncbi:MAG: PilN domain-containing protein [Thermodesulfobacteriota bacterium]